MMATPQQYAVIVRFRCREQQTGLNLEWSRLAGLHARPHKRLDLFSPEPLQPQTPQRNNVGNPLHHTATHARLGYKYKQVIPVRKRRCCIDAVRAYVRETTPSHRGAFASPLLYRSRYRQETKPPIKNCRLVFSLLPLRCSALSR